MLLNFTLPRFTISDTRTDSRVTNLLTFDACTNQPINKEQAADAYDSNSFIQTI